VRKSSQIHLTILATAAMSMTAGCQSQWRGIEPWQSSRVLDEVGLLIERGGFGSDFGEWAFYLALGAGVVFLLAQSGGE
jgi:hypothetical protein